MHNDKNFTQENVMELAISPILLVMHTYTSHILVFYDENATIWHQDDFAATLRNNKRNGPSVTIRNYEKYSEFYDGTFLFLAAAMHYDNDNNDGNKSATSPFCWLRSVLVLVMWPRGERKKMER